LKMIFSNMLDAGGICNVVHRSSQATIYSGRIQF
jgi:hypothetical protein